MVSEIGQSLRAILRVEFIFLRQLGASQRVNLVERVRSCNRYICTWFWKDDVSVRIRF